jgi:hypothetical protein
MDLNSEQASIALNDISEAQRKVTIFTGYQHAAPHFWLWGVIWFIGYSATDLQPGYAGEIWLTLNLIGFMVGAWLARANAAQARGSDARAHNAAGIPARQVIFVGLAFALFIAATFILFNPTKPTQFATFPALLVGFVYTLVGIWGGARWLVAGIGLSVLTMVGYLYAPQHIMLWMAVFGGGTLIASGFWMKGR